MTTGTGRDFSGRSEAFFLAMEAHRIRYAHQEESKWKTLSGLYRFSGSTKKSWRKATGFGSLPSSAPMCGERRRQKVTWTSWWSLTIPGFFRFLQLEQYLSDLLGVRVELVTRQALKPHIGKYILQEALPI